MIKARVIADTANKYNGKRITTLELTYPRFIHAEFMTHRVFSRNGASSRAIPITKFISMVEKEPAMPIWWGKNQKGMAAVEEIEQKNEACRIWLEARDAQVSFVKRLTELGLHKQLTNRLLEPWLNMVVVCTSTEWSNFIRLRDHKDAQPEIAELAKCIKKALLDSIPKVGLIHLPFVMEDEMALGEENLKKISAARCARTSYLTHDGVRDCYKDMELYNRLIEGSGFGHWSPLEHPATALENAKEWSGNFKGWRQFRKEFPLPLESGEE